MKKLTLLVLIFIITISFNSCRSITNAALEINIDKNSVILSFDDGPNAYGDTTTRLLDVLKKYQIRAMFALLGENVEKNPALVRRIYEEGHIIINHGYSDKWAYKMKDDEFRNNLVKGEAAIAAALGDYAQPRFYRPQGGFYYRRHERIWREEGWIMLSGKIRAWDAAKDESGKQKVIKLIINKTEKNGGGMVLLHDAKNSFPRMEAELAKNPTGSYNRAWIPSAVEEIIITLLKKGYHFNTTNR
jgi:peptidoglycan/xylan/chitin deacetylase (PgdA/CDA1 family)